MPQQFRSSVSLGKQTYKDWKGVGIEEAYGYRQTCFVEERGRGSGVDVTLKSLIQQRTERFHTFARVMASTTAIKIHLLATT